MNVHSFSLAEQAAGQIMDMIVVEHRFRPGDKLPNEFELAEELGISRITLREAVRILCTRNIVEIRRGRGTFVLSYEQQLPGANLSPLEFETASVRDLLEIRMMVEPAAAYYAALRATDDEIKQIRHLCERLEKAAAMGENPIKLEQDFHNAIARASHNQFMTKLMPIINKSVYTDLMYLDGSLAYSLQDHREIVRFIETRNGEAARTVMRLHILHVYYISNLPFE